MNLLYKSEHFASYQCDAKRCFFLVYGGNMIKLSFCQLLAFRQKINKIDLESHFNNSNYHGIEILSLCNREHLLVLNTLEVVDLKQLVKATFGVFELTKLVEQV